MAVAAIGCVVLSFVSTALAQGGASSYYTPAPELVKPIGSNPRANKMTEAAFQSFTAEWRARFERYVSKYSPDYSNSQWMLGPPKEGRLPTPLPLARGGRALAEIVVDLDPALHTPEATLGRNDYPAEVAVMRHTGHIIVKNAADELKHWLGTLTGADFPVVKYPTSSPRTRIVLGANFARQFFPADLAKLAAAEALDGFAVRTKGNAVFIFGATAKGTLNGVYAFLENNSDIIWAHGYSDLGTVYTVNPDLRVVWGDGLEIPGTIQRGWFGHYRERNGVPEPFWMWQMRNRSNFIVAPGPSPKVAEWGCWREGGGHCLATAAPHRGQDFFPLIRDPKTGVLAKPEKIQHYHHNLCMTHPDLPALYAEKLVDDIRRVNEKTPDTPLSAFRLAIEDPGPEKEYGVCNCELCLRPIRLPDGNVIPYQHATKEGLTFRSAQFYLLLEPIARAVEKALPGTRLSTYAYYFTAEPPPFQTSVQPMLCPYGGGGQLVHRDYLHPLFWQTNAKWWNYAYGWSRTSELTVLRDYNGLLTNGRPFAEIVAWDVRALRKMGIKRFGNETALDTAFLQMDFWVASRIYWNPDADVEALRKFYIRRTFREGAPEMEQFFGEIRKWWYTSSGLRREDFVNLGWIIGLMKQKDQLYQHLVKAEAMAVHPLAKANIVRLRKTYAIWFHLDPEEATADAMLANARLGRHVRYSSFMHEGKPVPVTYVSYATPKPHESGSLMTPADLETADFTGWTFNLRLRPVGDAARPDFQPPLLSFGNGGAAPVPMGKRPTPATGPATPNTSWTPEMRPERQRDGSYLFRWKLQKIKNSPFDPSKFSCIRLTLPEGAWTKPPRGTTPEYAIYDLQLIDPQGKRYTMPTLKAQQGSLARKRWFEGGEMGK